MSDREGTIWLAAKDALWSLDQGRLQCIPGRRGFSDSEIRDDPRSRWQFVAGHLNGLWRFTGPIQFYTRKDGLPHDHVEGSEDREGSLGSAPRGAGWRGFMTESSPTSPFGRAWLTISPSASFRIALERSGSEAMRRTEPLH